MILFALLANTYSTHNALKVKEKKCLSKKRYSAKSIHILRTFRTITGIDEILDVLHVDRLQKYYVLYGLTHLLFRYEFPNIFILQGI